MAKKTRIITLGLTEKPLTRQLDGLIPEQDARHFDRLNSAINLLVATNLLKEPEITKARKRLMKRIKFRINLPTRKR